MDFGCSLHMVNLGFYEINRNQRECRYFWEELLRNVATAGFQSIELPFEPYWKFGGRNGIPFHPYCIENSYGSLKNFRRFLEECGIRKISNLYFDPRFLESDDLDLYFGAYEHFIFEAIDEAAGLDTEDVIVSVSEEIGYLKSKWKQGESFEQFCLDYKKRTVAVLKKAVRYAKLNNISLSIKNEFWGLGRGMETAYYLERIPEIKYAPDLAHLAIADTDIEQILEKYIHRINVVTFSDTAYEDTQHNFKEPSPEYPAAGEEQMVYCDLGKGRVPLAKHFRQLKQLGYQGKIVCESKHTQDYCRALLRMKRVTDGLNGGGKWKI